MQFFCFRILASLLPRSQHFPEGAVSGFYDRSIAETPPSTNRLAPQTKDESSVTRNSTALAASAGSPGRFAMFGTGREESNSSLPTGEPILFGTMALTRILCGASCAAMARVRLATPPLAAE